MTDWSTKISIPRPGAEELPLTLEAGRSTVIIGANGSGKTRLGVYLEETLKGDIHRLSAHKSLTLSDEIALISLELAEKKHQFGHQAVDLSQRNNQRWSSKPAVHLLADFESLLQRLFAENNRVAIRHMHEREHAPAIPVPTTHLKRIKSNWDRLLPHRVLEILEASIRVHDPRSNQEPYAGSDMSDGERAIFYFLGQCLSTTNCRVLLIDEPEGHIHKAILGALWDAIERARPDCAFLYITHDLDFAMSRVSADRYFLRSYVKGAKPAWDIETLPSDTGLPGSILAEVVGSRRPVLLVEGERGSLDLTLYRHRYEDFTVIPVGSCEVVLHGTRSFNLNPSLHWLQVRGLVDGDAAPPPGSGVIALPVAEVENLLLLPPIFVALAEALHCDNPPNLLEKLIDQIVAEARQNLEQVCARHTAREINRRLTRVTLESRTQASLMASFQAELSQIDPARIFEEFKASLEIGLEGRDLVEILRLYDNKGLLAKASRLLELSHVKALQAKVGRLLGTPAGQILSEQLAIALPHISVEGTQGCVPGPPDQAIIDVLK